MTADPWSFLRLHTSARIALGRSGGSILTRELLDFRLSQARARDAVHRAFDGEALAIELAARLAGVDGFEMPVEVVRTRAGTRADYLLRPDLGRRLDDDARRRLARLDAECDLALIVSDGLSAEAACRHALSFIVPMVTHARRLGLSVGPLVVVEGGRVAVQDEIGALLRAKVALIALGERPGLSSADSLGAYFVFAPRRGRSDAERNCLSNIRDGGLDPAVAARKAIYLIHQSLTRGVSGVALKDDGGCLPP